MKRYIGGKSSGNIHSLVPSAELSAAQAVDEAKATPCCTLIMTFLFRSFVEHWNRSTPEDILTWYLAGVLEEKIGCAQGLVAEYFATPQEFIADLNVGGIFTQAWP